MIAAPLDAVAPRERPARELLRHGLTVMGFSTVVATLLYLIRGQRGWLDGLVYSQAIGLCTWAVIDVGRLVLRGDGDAYWPGGWRTPVLIGSGILLGYVAGTFIGDAYCGCSTWDSAPPRAFVSYFAISLTVSAIAMYYFHSKAQMQEQRTRIAATQRDAAQARLDVLRTQIEPHMLFNTLANLRVLISVDPPRAQAMLDQLIAFLRATLEASRAGSHALSAEFARVDDYLALMKVRMGARLDVRLDLPAELADLPVPPLLLQPLVENAIKHGLEPKVEGGRIDVAARRDGRELVLTVQDSGVGLGAPGADGARFGLHQVRERLATLHGERARLALQPGPGPGGGAVATIRLPLEP